MSLRITRRDAVRLAAMGALVLAPQESFAQLGKLTKKIKEKAGEAVDQVQPKTVTAPGQSPAQGSTPTPSQTGGRKVWANYDFVPGQRTLFFTDFTDETVGNFPQRLQFKTGSMEVVELDGQRVLKATNASGFVIPLGETLPARFTVEIDVINRNSMGVAAPTLKIYGGTAAKTDIDTEKTRVAFGHLGWDVTGGGTESQASFTSEEAEAFKGHPVSVRILGDGAYLKVYADGRRLANIPNASFARGRGIFVALEGRDEEANAVYVTRIRVAESEKTVYDALASTGRWATQGILFETGKSAVRPESAPTLKEIAAALAKLPAVRVRIEGHTDNVGSADDNMRLSQARAAAVKDALVKEHGIDASRLETAGLGDTKPVADNKTPEGRSSNRRVEVVKL